MSIAPSEDDRSVRDYHVGVGGAGAKIFNKAMEDIKYVVMTLNCLQLRHSEILIVNLKLSWLLFHLAEN